MISFRSGPQRISLGAGERWAAESGAPTYHDTAATELREIVAEVSGGEPWRDCVRRHYTARHPWLARIVTDPSRDRFFREHPPAPGSRILDIGAGWGQISLPLARDHAVVALEPTPERLAFIHAAARQDGVADRMAFIEADFMAVEFEADFDLVCCIGVLEWVPKFQTGDPWTLQRDFLQRIREALAPGGRLVVGIENRLGLKYLLGSRDDHIALPNIAVLDRAAAGERYRRTTGGDLRSFTYSLVEYEELFAAAGFAPPRAYAAFPDYKIPALIARVGDELNRLVLGGAALPSEHDGASGEQLDADRQLDLRSHYRSLAALGIASAFAPSFFLVADASAPATAPVQGENIDRPDPTPKARPPV